jgi:hypothetical protein
MRLKQNLFSSYFQTIDGVAKPTIHTSGWLSYLYLVKKAWDNAAGSFFI